MLERNFYDIWKAARALLMKNTVSTPLTLLLPGSAVKVRRKDCP